MNNLSGEYLINLGEALSYVCEVDKIWFNGGWLSIDEIHTLYSNYPKTNENKQVIKNNKYKQLP